MQDRVMFDHLLEIGLRVDLFGDQRCYFLLRKMLKRW